MSSRVSQGPLERKYRAWDIRYYPSTVTLHLSLSAGYWASYRAVWILPHTRVGHHTSIGHTSWARYLVLIAYFWTLGIAVRVYRHAPVLQGTTVHVISSKAGHFVFLACSWAKHSCWATSIRIDMKAPWRIWIISTYQVWSHTSTICWYLLL